jgi:hypothetical protein
MDRHDQQQADPCPAQLPDQSARRFRIHLDSSFEVDAELELVLSSVAEIRTKSPGESESIPSNSQELKSQFHIRDGGSRAKNRY